MVSIEQQRTDRYRFLKALYDETNGDPFLIIDMWSLGEKLGFTREYTQLVVSYLDGERLTEQAALGGQTAITHYGRKEVEDAETNPEQPTQHFPVNVAINVGKIEHSQIITGQSNITTMTSGIDGNINALRVLLEEISSQLDRIEQKDDNLNQILSDLTSALSQLRAPRPDHQIIKLLLDKIKAGLTFIGGALAEGYIQRLAGF